MARLRLKRQNYEGHGWEECRTIEQACSDVLDRADTDFTEILYASAREDRDVKDVISDICKGSAKVCKKKPPPKVKNRIDYDFRIMSDDERTLAKQEALLKEIGNTASMYSLGDTPVDQVRGKGEGSLSPEVQKGLEHQHWEELRKQGHDVEKLKKQAAEKKAKGEL